MSKISKLNLVKNGTTNSIYIMGKAGKNPVDEALKHPNLPGEGAKKRKKLKNKQDKVAAVMKEFHNGTLHDGHGKIVTDVAQAKAIAMSEAGLNKAVLDYDFLVSVGLDDPEILEKAKYIKRIPKSGGGYTYIYNDNQKNNISKLTPEQEKKEAMNKLNEHTKKFTEGKISHKEWKSGIEKHNKDIEVAEKKISEKNKSSKDDFLYQGLRVRYNPMWKEWRISGHPEFGSMDGFKTKEEAINAIDKAGPVSKDDEDFGSTWYAANYSIDRLKRGLSDINEWKTKNKDDEEKKKLIIDKFNEAIKIKKEFESKNK